MCPNAYLDVSGSISPPHVTVQLGSTAVFRYRYSSPSSSAGGNRTQDNSYFSNPDSTTHQYLTTTHVIIRLYTAVSLDDNDTEQPLLIYNGRRVNHLYEGVYRVDDKPKHLLQLFIDTRVRLKDAVDASGTYEFLQMPDGILNTANLTVGKHKVC